MATDTLHITREDTGEQLSERERFLADRRRGLGGSDAASLFPEEAKYGCPTRLWYDKRATRPDYERTQAEQRILDRGNRFEEKVAELFIEEYGFKLRRQPTKEMKDAPYLRVNIDRQIIGVTTEELNALWPEMKLEVPCGPGVLEVKTSNRWVARDVIKNGIAVDYLFQLQHALMVTGYRWGVMAVLDTSSLELTCFPMARNEKLIGIIRERAEAFWALVENGPKPEPPDFPDGATRCRSCVFRKTCRGEQFLMQLAGEKPDTGYVSDDSFAELASDLRDIRAQEEVIKQTKEEIVSRIQERMQFKEISKLEIPSVGAKIRWAEQKGANRWDSKALEAEGGTIARESAFAKWVAEQNPELLTAWLETVTGQKFHLADKYKRPGAPTRPFVFISL